MVRIKHKSLKKYIFKFKSLFIVISLAVFLFGILLIVSQENTKHIVTSNAQNMNNGDISVNCNNGVCTICTDGVCRTCTGPDCTAGGSPQPTSSIPSPVCMGSCPTDMPQPSDNPQPTDEPFPSDVPQPSDNPQPTDEPFPTDVPEPTDAPEPSDIPFPTDNPQPSEAQPTDSPIPNPGQPGNGTILDEIMKLINDLLSSLSNWISGLSRSR